MSLVLLGVLIALALLGFGKNLTQVQRRGQGRPADNLK
jgi:hypothetical protein